MKNVKRMLSLLILAALLGALMTTAALADEVSGVWLRVTEDAESGTVTAWIVTNTAVTAGNVKISYDPDVLTYQELAEAGDPVKQYSVNPGDPGAVRIAWVSTAEATASGDGLALLSVTFTGADGSGLELSGVIYDAAGAPVTITPICTDNLTAAISGAQALNAADYTAESWAEVNAALEAAQAVLADPTATQSETDSAAAALTNAVAALEAAPVNPPANPDDDGNSETGDKTPIVPILIIMGVCLIGIILLVIILFRKGRKK